MTVPEAVPDTIPDGLPNEPPRVPAPGARPARHFYRSLYGGAFVPIPGAPESRQPRRTRAADLLGPEGEHSRDRLDEEHSYGREEEHDGHRARVKS